MNWLLNPRVLSAIAVTAVLTFAYLHYIGLVSDLTRSREDLVSARANAEIAISAANGNAEQLRKAQAEHRFTVAIIEGLQDELAGYGAISSAAEAEIRQSPQEMNPPVAPVLEQLRARRFGGPK